jgi:L-lactate dehydrogenase complex protein LldG
MNNSSRQQILDTIRKGLNRGELSDASKQRLTERLASHPAHCIPARSRIDHDAQVELFKQMAREAAAALIELDSLQQLPLAVCELAEPLQLDELVTTGDCELTDLDWPEPLPFKLSQRVAQAGDSISLTNSFAAIAETGTLMLHSSPDSPTTLNFLPDIHLVATKRSQVVGCYEQAWQLLRERNHAWPRTVNMITGPSRSADIEQKLQMGAHGPKRLVILFIND